MLTEERVAFQLPKNSERNSSKMPPRKKWKVCLFSCFTTITHYVSLLTVTIHVVLENSHLTSTGFSVYRGAAIIQYSAPIVSLLTHCSS